jgi:hypothetical protein
MVDDYQTGLQVDVEGEKPQTQLLNWPINCGDHPMSETRECECGAIYERTEDKVAFRDKDSFSCHFCGVTLESWSGSRIPIYKVKHKPTGHRTGFEKNRGAD